MYDGKSLNLKDMDQGSKKSTSQHEKTLLVSTFIQI